MQLLVGQLAQRKLSTRSTGSLRLLHRLHSSRPRQHSLTLSTDRLLAAARWSRCGMRTGKRASYLLEELLHSVHSARCRQRHRHRHETYCIARNVDHWCWTLVDGLLCCRFNSSPHILRICDLCALRPQCFATQISFPRGALIFRYCRRFE